MFNKLVRVGKNSELRSLPNGTPVLSFPAVYDIGFGQNKKAQWLDCTMFGDRATKVVDYILKGKIGIEYISNILNKHNFYFSKHHPTEGDALYTYFFAGNPKELLRVLPKIEGVEQYDNLMKIYGSESNGLENLFHHIFKNEGSIYREEESVFHSKSKEMFSHKEFSQIEYFTILPSNKPNFFIPYFHISNSKDSRIVKYKVYRYNIEIWQEEINIEQTHSFWDSLEFNGEYKIIFEISDKSGFSQTKSFKINQDYFNNILPNNGTFTLKI